jgi:hypothetical protein
MMTYDTENEAVAIQRRYALYRMGLPLPVFGNSLAPSLHGTREERPAKMLDDRDRSAQDDREDPGAAVMLTAAFASSGARPGRDITPWPCERICGQSWWP